MPDLMTIDEAARYLQVTRQRLSRLIVAGVLTTRPNPLDARSKLLDKADLEALRLISRPAPKLKAAHPNVSGSPDRESEGE